MYKDFLSGVNTHPHTEDQQLFSQKFVSIILTFTLTIFLRLFLSHKDYLTTNFNRKINPTTKFFFTRRITLKVETDTSHMTFKNI